MAKPEPMARTGSGYDFVCSGDRGGGLVI